MQLFPFFFVHSKDVINVSLFCHFDISILSFRYVLNL